VQAEEDAALASMLSRLGASQGSVNVADPAATARAHAGFVASVEDAINKVKRYEDELAQAMALSVMDLDALRTRAQEGVALSTLLDEEPPLMEEDALAMEILNWFKLRFFKWVDQPECCVCQRAGLTQLQGTMNPNPDEAEYGASRTEVYRCRGCLGVTRFPRYNDPVKLLDTRCGRCGEWANCFALCCRAAGLEIRLALDWEDHVWVEYYSNAMSRWVHMDPCEAAYDKPLLYEAGWGKQLSYVIAVGVSGAADVTKRYTKQFKSLLPRRSCSEAWVDSYLRATTTSLRSSLPKDLVQTLVLRDAKDVASMQAASESPLGDNESYLPGRQTGSSEWVASRGEDGAFPSRAKEGGLVQPVPPLMRYRWARDGDAPNAGDANTSRVCGGVVRASGENPPQEVVECAFDGKGIETKWLDFNGCKRDTAWLEYRMLPCDDPVTLDRYALTSANDAIERDPSHFVLEMWDEEGVPEWVFVEERKDIQFPGRGCRLEFVIQGKKPCSRRYRLRIISVRDPKSANSVQLGGWDLYSTS
jgi:peptide-N4-(N-acetyl-beta-glucosaminyl)asparagine amidase